MSNPRGGAGNFALNPERAREAGKKAVRSAAVTFAITLSAQLKRAVKGVKRVVVAQIKMLHRVHRLNINGRI